ncbi:MAG: hypothetical protein ACI4IL_06830 [Eubacterium sp.]
MKKIIALLIASALIICLSACSNTEQKTETTTEKTTVSTTTRLATDKAVIKESEAIELIKGYSAKELGLTEDEKKECSFMVAKYGEEIDGKKYVKVVATVKTEAETDGEITYTLKNKGEYYIGFDGKEILSKDLSNGSYSNLELKQ